MRDLTNHEYVIIGLGNIGAMLVERLIHLGVSSTSIHIADENAERARGIESRLGGVVVNLDDLSAISPAVWMLCTGPRAILPVIQKIKPWLKPEDFLISFAAAVSIENLENAAPNTVNVIRVMPNMPSLVGSGFNPVCFSRRNSAASRSMMLELLTLLGQTIEVNDEQMNWCVGLSGAAMRSILPMIEGLVRAGAEAGFTEEEARFMAARVVSGTGNLVAQSKLSLTEIKDLTPMQTLDEVLLEGLAYQTVIDSKRKIDQLQKKIEAEASV